MNKQSRLGRLVYKIKQRNKELEAQRRVAENIITSESKNIGDHLRKLSGLDDLGLYNFDKFGNVKKPPKEESIEEDNFQMQKELKVERQRQRAEKEVTMEQKERSAGELALLFMGINQAAYEMLAENPMTGYMNSVVFTRVLGHDDIEQGQYWMDCSQCWICAKWDKISIAYTEQDDKAIFNQKVT